MVVTPFGDLTVGDHVALERWLDNHHRRHTAQVARMQGPPGGSLRGPIQGDWFLRHLARHVALATFTSTQLGSSTEPLLDAKLWETDQGLREWHNVHNRIHLLQDRALGLS